MRNIIAAAFKQKLLSISAPSHSAAAETIEKTGVDRRPVHPVSALQTVFLGSALPIVLSSTAICNMTMYIRAISPTSHYLTLWKLKNLPGKLLKGKGIANGFLWSSHWSNSLFAWQFHWLISCKGGLCLTTVHYRVYANHPGVYRILCSYPMRTDKKTDKELNR